MNFYNVLRPLLFKLDAEKAHILCLNTINYLNKAKMIGNKYEINQEFKLFNLVFKNKIGLAAGLDKNGEYIDALGALGFGFIEVGTVTPKPQSGNPLPRLWRLEQHKSIINKMGFNNQGVDKLIENIKNSKWVKQGGIIGVNIGKNAITPIENALDDYLICLEKVYNYANYIVINISSPNTKNLRDLQSGDNFCQLLKGLKNKQYQLYNYYKKYTPILIKISPDLDINQIEFIAKNLLTFEIDGVIAANTTIDKTLFPSNIIHEGGLSGELIANKSNEVLKILSSYINKQIPIIGVGGIMYSQDCLKKISLGASLVQIYSGFIYNGSKFIQDCIKITA